MAKKYVQIGDKKYLRVKDKLVEIDRFDESGKPIISARSQEVRHDDGRVDMTIIVPCLQIAAEPKSG